MNRFIPKIFSDKTIAILPISRLVFSYPFRIGPYFFFPPEEFGVQLANPIAQEDFYKRITSQDATHLMGQDLRWAASSMADFSLLDLDNSYNIVFSADVDWDKFKNNSHEDDVELIRYLSSKAEKALDVIRYKHCRFDLPETIPGAPGSWEKNEKPSGQFMGALIYNPLKNESRLITGAAVESVVAIKGIGLHIATQQNHQCPSPDIGEVSGIISNALSIYSDVLMAQNQTAKFIRAMTLLEYLAGAGEFGKWEKHKGNIACHVAKSKADYLNICERFKVLTGGANECGHKGLRTEIVHLGKFLPDIVPSVSERKKLFKELQNYAERVINHMYARQSESWESFLAYRKELKVNLGIQ